jgi:hypothetical protein
VGMVPGVNTAGSSSYTTVSYRCVRIDVY